MSLTYLNIKSGYSFLRSSLKISDIVNKAKELNLSSLALTDLNNMFGAMEFNDLCVKNNIKPIIGMEIKLDTYETPLILIATSNQGYFSLCKLTSFISTSDLKQCTRLEDLKECNNGVIAILPYIRSFFHEATNDEKNDLVKKIRSIFTSFYIGLEYYGENTATILNQAREYCKQFSLNSVPLNEVLCESYESTYLLDVLQRISLINTSDEFVDKNYDCKYFLNELKIKSIFSKEEIYESNRIASICEYHFDNIKSDLVKYPVKDNYDSYDYLYALAFKGLEKRLNGRIVDSYKKRLEYELSIIKKMNFVNYFLVVYDYVKYAKQNGIMVGPGRGSSCGCLTCYSLGITNVDPLKYNLLFERFLNPERVSMPDIDVDFIDSRRDQVIDYLIQKYGADKIGRVTSFSTLKAKSALGNVAKAFGCSTGEQVELSKALNSDDDDKASLKEMANSSPTFMSLVNTNEKYKKIYNVALKLEGLPRQTGTHAAGVVCCNDPISNVIPVYKTSFAFNESYITMTQFNDDYIERFNLYKMDLLGLTNLSIIEDCLYRIKKDKGVSINLFDIDLNDPSIYKFLDKGLFGGIFQIDKNAIKPAVKQLHPGKFEELAVCLALGRPATMEYVKTYSDRKKNIIKTVYPNPSLEPILKETYGIMVYEEQVLQVLCKMAGFTLGKADLVRRGIKKKNIELIKQHKEDFINGCLKNGYTKENAEKVFSDVEKFSGYGFNKSHTIAYGMITAYMCYLKANYPLQFYCSILNFADDDNKVSQYISEMKRLGIKIENPSINYSSNNFEIHNDAITFSLNRIKGLKANIVKTILDERRNGFYNDFVDFVRRVYAYGIDKNHIMSLIDSGAFDEFKLNRNTLRYNLETCIMYASIVSKLVDGRVELNLIVDSPKIIEYKDDDIENASKEFEELNIYLSSFPLIKDRQKISDAGYLTIANLDEGMKNVRIVAKINRFKKIKTKKGDYMAFVDLEDETGLISAVVYPEQFTAYENIIVKDSYVQIKGDINLRNDELNLICNIMKEYNLE